MPGSRGSSASVPGGAATRVSRLPPVASLFAAFLGYNPMKTLLGHHVLHALPLAQQHVLAGRAFFPSLLSAPFHSALVYAFAFAIAACVIAALASALRGGKYHWAEEDAVLHGEAPLGLTPTAGEPEATEDAPLDVVSARS